MFFKSFLFVPVFTIAMGMSQQTFADDAIPPDIQKELAEAKRSLIEATERLDRVEAKIANLIRDTQSDDLDGTDFAWRALGLRIEEFPADAFEDVNEAYRTKYHGAMKVTAVRPGSPAEAQGIQIGDLLLGVDGMQTITNAHIRRLADRESGLVAKKKVKFYIIRNGQALFGHFALTQPQ